jgi:hypothetical protein
MLTKQTQRENRTTARQYQRDGSATGMVQAQAAKSYPFVDSPEEFGWGSLTTPRLVRRFFAISFAMDRMPLWL